MPRFKINYRDDEHAICYARIFGRLPHYGNEKIEDFKRFTGYFTRRQELSKKTAEEFVKYIIKVTPKRILDNVVINSDVTQVILDVTKITSCDCLCFLTLCRYIEEEPFIVNKFVESGELSDLSFLKSHKNIANNSNHTLLGSQTYHMNYNKETIFDLKGTWGEAYWKDDLPASENQQYKGMFQDTFHKGLKIEL